MSTNKLIERQNSKIEHKDYLKENNLKSCHKCNKEKSLDCFSKRRNSLDGLLSYCRNCRIIIRGTPENKQKRRNYSQKKYYNDHEYREKWLAYRRKKNKTSEYKKHKQERHKERMKTDPNYRVSVTYRKRLNTVIRRLKRRGFEISKYKGSLKLLGCTAEELRVHLEKQFRSGMTWQNHGTEWHIDHIKSCDSHDLIKLEEQEKCFHYSNLQPLWITTEIAKKYGESDEYIGNLNKGSKLL